MECVCGLGLKAVFYTQLQSGEFQEHSVWKSSLLQDCRTCHSKQPACHVPPPHATETLSPSSQPPPSSEKGALLLPLHNF